MKRVVSIIFFSIVFVFSCFGQSMSNLISIKDLIEKRNGNYCIRGEFAGMYDITTLVFFVNQDDYIIPIRLQKKDIGAKKRFLTLNLKEGDIVYIKGTLDEIEIDSEKYKGLVDAIIIDELDIIDESNSEIIPPRFNFMDATAFSYWVNAHLNYPKKAVKNGIQGRVILQFTVDADGIVSNVILLRGVEPSLDREAIRVVSSSPKWLPGQKEGKPVSITYTFPVVFQLR